jgi:hypothetical protein
MIVDTPRLVKLIIIQHVPEVQVPISCSATGENSSIRKEFAVIPREVLSSYDDLYHTVKLDGQGVNLGFAYRDVPQIGLKIACVVNPLGTRIERTERLAGK